MNIYLVDRQSVITQTVQNMVEAGVLKPDEHELLTRQLQKLDSKDLLVALLDSWNLREEAPKYIDFYPINFDAISQN